jgi:hypothetical protein
MKSGSQSLTNSGTLPSFGNRRQRRHTLKEGLHILLGINVVVRVVRRAKERIGDDLKFAFGTKFGGHIRRDTKSTDSNFARPWR